MKIYNNRPLNGQTPNISPGTGQEGIKKVSEEITPSTRKSELQKGSGDRVDISERAKEVAKLMEAIRAMPEIRTDKVEELRSAIQSGKYRIDSLKIAERILKEI